MIGQKVRTMRFSVGVDDFKKIRTEKDSLGRLCFYCDKSLLIRGIIDDGASVIVLPPSETVWEDIEFIDAEALF